jgi:hypothetical protein
VPCTVQACHDVSDLLVAISRLSTFAVLVKHRGLPITQRTRKVVLDQFD